MAPPDSAILPAIVLALRKRLGDGRKAKRATAQTAPDRPSPPLSFSGIDLVISLLRTVAFIVVLLAYLVVEMFAAMLAYAYLNIYQINTFGYLIKQSRNFLTSLQVFFETHASADLANQAYATLLGEIGPKSIMLLFLGLAVSMLIRFMVWLVHLLFGNVWARKPASGVKA
jgi:hypothetical protein